MGNREGDGNASPSYKHLQRSGADSGAWVGLQGFKVRIETLFPIFQDSSCRLIIYGATSVQWRGSAEAMSVAESGGFGLYQFCLLITCIAAVAAALTRTLGSVCRALRAG